jgi:tetratricopeptide (TPR) repeat protein
LATAGDSRQALNQYEQALRLAPSDKNALAGAGTTAFTLGDYLQARNYLRRAPADVDDVARTREIVDLVLSSDPLASRIGSPERRRRLAASLDYADERLKGCEQVGAAAGPNSTATLQEEIASLREQLKPSTDIDQDSIEAGLDLFGRIERQLAETCPPLTANDRALALIARSHATDSK